MFSSKPHLLTRRPSPTTAEFIISTQPPPTLALRVAAGVGHVLRIFASLSAFLMLLSLWTLSPYFPGSSGMDPTTILDQSSSSFLASIPPPSPPSSDTDFLFALLTYIQYHTAPGRLALQIASASYYYSFTSASPTTTTLATTAAAVALQQPPSSSSSFNSSTGGLGSPPPLTTHHSSPQLVHPPPPAILLLLCAIILYLSVLRPHIEERLLVLRGLGIQTSTSAPFFGLAPRTRFIPTEKIQDFLINEAFLGFTVRHYLAVVVEGEEDVVVVFPRLLPRRNVVEKVWKGVRGCLHEDSSSSSSGGGLGSGGGGNGAVGAGYDSSGMASPTVGNGKTAADAQFN